MGFPLLVCFHSLRYVSLDLSLPIPTLRGPRLPSPYEKERYGHATRGLLFDQEGKPNSSSHLSRGGTSSSSLLGNSTPPPEYIHPPLHHDDLSPPPPPFHGIITSEQTSWPPIASSSLLPWALEPMSALTFTARAPLQETKMLTSKPPASIRSRFGLCSRTHRRTNISPPPLSSCLQAYE